MNPQPCFTILLWIMMTTIATGLKCWKCIAHDCEMVPDENYKASKVQCKEGQSCMKVRYRMFDNYTHFDSIIRTCSSGPCATTTTEQFQACVRQTNKYMVSGCVLKSCCKDRDLCNSANTLSISRVFLLLCLIYKIICFPMCVSTSLPCINLT